MEQGNNDNDAIKAFVTFMNQKGYRGRYLLDQTAGIMMTGNLSECLETFIRLHRNGGTTSDLVIETNPPYEPSINCRFRLDYDEARGFLIREMEIQQQKSGEKKLYRTSNNNQIPGSQAVGALFPRPKPWSHHLKGKFRP